MKKIHQAKKLLFIIIKKNKAKLFNNVSEKNINDNKRFWKTLKPVLPNKSVRSEKIISYQSKMKKILSNDNEIEEVLNNFFSNIKTLVIP